MVVVGGTVVTVVGGSVVVIAAPSTTGASPTQPRLVQLPVSRSTRKSKRLGNAGSGEGAAPVNGLSSSSRGGANLFMVSQYRCPVSVATFSGGMSTPARYRLVLTTLVFPSAPRTIGSFGGTRATGAAWSAAATSSLSARLGDGSPFCDRSGAVNGAQPSSGSSLLSTSPSSDPLERVTAPASSAWLAAENCAVRPSAVARYLPGRLSLWSWSTTLKSRVVGHGLPSLPVARAGIASLPALIAALAAAKNRGAPQ